MREHEGVGPGRAPRVPDGERARLRLPPRVGGGAARRHELAEAEGKVQGGLGRTLRLGSRRRRSSKW